MRFVERIKTSPPLLVYSHEHTIKLSTDRPYHIRIYRVVGKGIQSSAPTLNDAMINAFTRLRHQ